MASYYGENIFTNGNNIQYINILYPILSNTNNANNYNVNTINQIQNYQVQANQYKTISYNDLIIQGLKIERKMAEIEEPKEDTISEPMILFCTTIFDDIFSE